MSPLLVSLLFALHAGPPTLVSPPWKTVQVPPDLAEFYLDHLAQALRREGFKVVTSSEVAALLSMERQKQLLGCSEEASACIAELGAAMGADGVLMVNLARLEDSYRGQLKIVSSRNSAVLSETSVEASGQKALLAALDDGAKRLAEGLPLALRPAAPVPAGTKRLWWIPALAAVGGAVTGTVGLVSAQDRYTTLTTQLTEGGVTEKARQTAASGATMQTLGWVGVGVAAAGLVGMSALLLFGSEPPVTPAVTLGPSGAGLVVGGTFP
jgi:hypothetical protein